MRQKKAQFASIDRPPQPRPRPPLPSEPLLTHALSLSLSSASNHTTPTQSHTRQGLSKGRRRRPKKKKPGLPAPGPRGRGHPGGCARPIRRWQGGRGEARRARRRWRRGGPVEARRKGGEDAPDGGERGGLAWRRREIGSFLLFLHLFSVTRDVSFFIPSLFFFKCNKNVYSSPPALLLRAAKAAAAAFEVGPRQKTRAYASSLVRSRASTRAPAAAASAATASRAALAARCLPSRLDSSRLWARRASSVARSTSRSEGPRGLARPSAAAAAEAPLRASP